MSYITLDQISLAITTAAEQAMGLMTEQSTAARNTAEWRADFDRIYAIENEDCPDSADPIIWARAAREADYMVGIDWPDQWHRSVFECRALAQLFPEGSRAHDISEALRCGYHDRHLEAQINAEIAGLPAIVVADLL